MMNKKKKIMLIVPMLHQGGYERMCSFTAKLLKDIYDIYLLIFSDKDIFYDVDDINVININIEAASGKIGKAINIAKRVRKIKAVKKELGIDLCYSFGLTANRINVLARCDDVIWTGIRAYGDMESDKAMKMICGKADNVVCCSKVMESDIRNQYKTNGSFCLYNPCNIDEIVELADAPIDEKFSEFINKPGKLVVSMGREDVIKGFWHLIKSIYLVKKEIPDVRLMIIGDGEFLEYKKLVEELGISDDVMFTGVQKNPFALLKKADIYALTSDSEGFPNALIEGMAVGLTCISVNCKTGPAEILSDDFTKCTDQHKTYYEKYGVLTPVFTGNPDMNPDNFTSEEEIFANEMMKLILNEDLCAKYKKIAVQRAKEYSIEAYVNNICEMIERDV